MLTAFTEIEKILKEKIEKIDYQSFKSSCIGDCRKLFSECYGMCCSLYLGITKQEADVFKRLVVERSQELKKIGVKLPKKVAVYDSQDDRCYMNKRRRSFWQLVGIVYTLIRRADKRYRPTFKLFKDFSYTCIFSLNNGDCVLQRLALSDNLHPWYYKPINCWKYPLSIDGGVLSVFKNEINPCFPCNQDNKCNGTPTEVLKDELNFLGQIVGCDLISDIKSH